MDADDYLQVLAADTHRRFAFNADSAERARSWQRAARAELEQLLGLPVIAARGAPPMSARRRARQEEADHVREDWTLETEPGFQLPFYLLRPPSAAGPLPLVITPHGHNKSGRRAYVGLADSERGLDELRAGERDIALQAVREGYLAIAPDMRGFAGLRRREEREQDANNSCRHLQMHAWLLGRTLVGERVWDVQRLIDWALAGDELDPHAIVISGNSGGGTVSLFAAAVDERIDVCVPGSYFCTFADSIGAVYHCECNYVPGLLRHGEMHDIAGLIAPRPFLAVNGRDDPIFPIAATERSHRRLRQVYQVLGAGESCRLSVGEGGHRYYKKDVWPFVRRALQEISDQNEPTSAGERSRSRLAMRR